MRAKLGVERSPRSANLDLRGVALLFEGAEPGREGLRRGARGVVVCCAARFECVDEPRPRDIGDKRIDPNLHLKGRLGEADDAKLTAPVLARSGIMHQDQATSAVGRITVVGGVRAALHYPSGERDGARSDALRRGNLANLQLTTKRRGAQALGGTLEPRIIALYSWSHTGDIRV